MNKTLKYPVWQTLSLDKIDFYKRCAELYGDADEIETWTGRLEWKKKHQKAAPKGTGLRAT